jgi:3',5'-cyclic AMP phosphodiesterase CpdA
MLIAHISDLHLVPQGRMLYDFVDANTACSRLVSHINAMPAQPDLVLVSGDTVNRGSRPAYATLRRLLKNLRSPAFVLPGNHDNPAMLRETADGFHRALAARMDYILEDFPVRILLMDSTLPDSVGGRLEPRQLDWLEKELDKERRPTLLAMHHPPLPSGNAHMDQYTLENGGEFLARIAACRHLLAVLCGHTHRAIFQRAGDLLCCTAPSTVTGIPTNFADPTGLFLPGESAFLLHSHTERGLISFVEPVPVAHPYPFYSVKLVSDNAEDDTHV